MLPKKVPHLNEEPPLKFEAPIVWPITKENSEESDSELDDSMIKHLKTYSKLKTNTTAAFRSLHTSSGGHNHEVDDFDTSRSGVKITKFLSFNPNYQQP